MSLSVSCIVCDVLYFFYRSASGFVPCVLQCLSSKDNDIVNSCLVNLPEFTLLAQGMLQFSEFKSIMFIDYMFIDW